MRCERLLCPEGRWDRSWAASRLGCRTPLPSPHLVVPADGQFCTADEIRRQQPAAVMRAAGQHAASPPGPLQCLDRAQPGAIVACRPPDGSQPALLDVDGLDDLLPLSDPRDDGVEG